MFGFRALALGFLSVMLATGGVFAFSASVRHAIFGYSFSDDVKRIQEIRQNVDPTGAVDARSLTLAASLGGIAISEHDYLLMGCDVSSTKRNYPGISHQQLLQPVSFAGDGTLKVDDLKDFNYTSTQRGGVWYVDTVDTGIPKLQYQASPQEVAWHCMRVMQLRAQGMEVDDRIRTMTEEAKTKPWEHLS